ncbi:MAG TPA: amino acid permease [Vicinamibacterales bacterium]|nr:amino acid permease [Vicinamibacterales bacterium]
MTHPHDRLPRTLGLGSATALVIGITIGSGIFRSPAGVAQKVADPTLFMALWIVGGLLALAGALSLAELAAAFPESGGYYAYLRESWGRPTAFLFGWTQLVLLRASAIGGIALACGQYTLRMLGVDPVVHSSSAQLVSAGAIIIAASANIVGARLGAAIVNASSSAKFVALIGLAVIALALGGAHGGTTANFATSAPVTVSAFGLALVSVLWAYDGWGDVSFAGGEVTQPQRTLPRAIIGGTLGVVVAYVLINAGYVYVLSMPGIARSPLVAADTMTAIVGPAGAALVSMLVAVSTFGALNADFLGSPRVFFAMADDGLFFKAIARVHPRFHTPHVAILLTAGMSVLLVFSRSFEALTETFVIAIWPFYGLCVAGVFRLRRLRPKMTRPYRVAGYPVVPAVFLVAVVGFLLNALISDPLATSITFAIILAGIPVYWFAFGRGRARVDRPTTDD